jgi:hypothetical protein
MSAPDTIPPIRDRLDLPRWLCQKGLIGEGAEIGVLFGEYSQHLLEYWPGLLHLIDPWKNQDPLAYLDGCNSIVMERAFQKTLAVAAPYAHRVEIHRRFSDVAAGGFKDGQLDWCYLDHNHGLEVMRADLPRYWAKVKPGGLLAGHDFYNRHDDWHDCGVEQAVREFCLERELGFYTTPCTSWWVEKAL